MRVAAEVAKWLIVTVMACSAVLTITEVGKPREPIRPEMAAVIVMANALFITLIAVFWYSGSAR